MRAKLFLIVVLMSTISYSLMVDQGVVEKSLYPGDTVTELYTLINDEGKQLKINVIAEDWPSSRQINDTTLVNFSENGFFLEAGDSKIIEVTALLPEGTVGEKRYMILFEGIPYKDGQPRASMFKNRVGYALYLIAKDTVERTIKVLSSKMKLEDNRIKYVIDIKNTGNVHLRPLAYLEIFNNKNEKLSRTDFPFGAALQPDKIVTLKVATKEEYKFGKYSVVFNMYLDVYIENTIDNNQTQMIVKVPVITEKNKELFYQEKSDIEITEDGELIIKD